MFFFFFQAEDGIRDLTVTGVQTCALPICLPLEDELPTTLPTETDPRPAHRAVASARRFLRWARPLAEQLDDATGTREYQDDRSEERRVGKECRCRWAAEQEEKK